MAKAIRDIYGEELAALAEQYPSVVVLDADVSGSTKSALFQAEAPNRFFNMGIAESNMMATCAGLAAAGKIPVANTFAVFMATAGLLSIRGQICYGNLNVKLAGGYCGLSDSYDGATHHACEDMAAMRAMPNMKVLVPCDETAARRLTRKMLDTDGPVYLRLSRDSCADVYSKDAGPDFPVGKGHVVREGGCATVIACGVMVGKALEAAEMLAKEGVEITVVDMYSIKPIDRELVVEEAKKTGAMVCAEEHSIVGGLGSAVAEVLTEEGLGLPVRYVGVKDVFTESGDYQELLEKYGLDAASIAAAVRDAIAAKAK